MHRFVPICLAMHSEYYYCLAFNHFSTIGRFSGTAHYGISIRQAAIAAFVTSRSKIFLTQNFSALWNHLLYIAFEGDDSAI